MTENMQVRIHKMYRGDIMFAWGFVIALWCSVIFVFYSINEGVTDGTLSAVLKVSGALVLLFNTASILAMVRQYSREKDFIYGLDIRHLDEMRAAQASK